MGLGYGEGRGRGACVNLHFNNTDFSFSVTFCNTCVVYQYCLQISYVVLINFETEISILVFLLVIKLSYFNVFGRL